jgi:hypothetical protein
VAEAAGAVINSWLDVLALAAWLPFLLFVIVQTPAVVSGRSNAAGVAVYVLELVAALSLSGSVWRQLAEQAPPHWYRLAVFVAVIVAGWWVFVSMLVVRRRDDGSSNVNGAPK